MGIRKMKVIEVTTDYFKLEDGSIFEHISPLDVIPSVEEFQEIYDRCYNFLTSENNND